MVSKIINEAKNKRYPGDRKRQVEFVDKAFTEDELKRFMAVVDDQEDYRAFMFLIVLGLRIGELVRLKGKDIINDELYVRSEKGSYHAKVRLPDCLMALLEMRDKHEPLFKYTQKQLRDHFKIYRQKAKLDQIYAYTEPCGQYNAENRRYRLTLHSFRHYAIKNFYDQSGYNVELTRSFARHRHLSATEVYLRSQNKAKIEEIINNQVRNKIMRGIYATS